MPSFHDPPSLSSTRRSTRLFRPQHSHGRPLHSPGSRDRCTKPSWLQQLQKQQQQQQMQQQESVVYSGRDDHPWNCNSCPRHRCCSVSRRSARRWLLIITIVTPLTLVANPQMLLSPQRILSSLGSRSSSYGQKGESGGADGDGGGIGGQLGGRPKRGEFMAFQVR